jgi:hypothetical protein
VSKCVCPNCCRHMQIRPTSIASAIRRDSAVPTDQLGDGVAHQTCAAGEWLPALWIARPRTPRRPLSRRQARRSYRWHFGANSRCQQAPRPKPPKIQRLNLTKWGDWREASRSSGNHSARAPASMAAWVERSVERRLSEIHPQPAVAHRFRSSSLEMLDRACQRVPMADPARHDRHPPVASSPRPVALPRVIRVTFVPFGKARA